MRATFLPTLLAKLILSAWIGLAMTSSANAHVELLSPNGGEILRGQQEFLIEWWDSQGHGETVTYSLEYSTDQGLTWEFIATDLPYTNGFSDYHWTVPEIDTMRAQIRVMMILTPMQYWEDVSDGDFIIAASYQSYGNGTPWAGLLPTLSGLGVPEPDSTIEFLVRDCEPGADIHFLCGRNALNLQRYGVTILSSTEFSRQVFQADANGDALLPAYLPPHARGLVVYAQALVASSGANSASAGLTFIVR